MIIVKNLNFNYKDKKILNNLNFEITKGTWVSLIGDNGSGKTTLAKLLIGLLSPNKGQIFINNEELTEDNLLEVRSSMGIVFQNPDYQFVGFDVENDIAFGLENKLLPREQIRKKIDEYSSMLNIRHLLHKKPQELSGGQKQKVAITSVLAMEPDIIIFDEPTSFLDPQSSKEIYDIIQNIHKQKNKILITITHDLSFAFRSDAIMALDKYYLWKYDKISNLLKDFSFLKKYFNYLPLGMKIYYELQKDKDLSKINPKKLQELKDCLWQYNSKM
ncbi:ATP-binding cassette domain-containing protein [Columbia Basin potato purple top phytoplasma]|uniref:ATP-binding cassette domain-containing protein n=1 Tax=Columbia Basin potato purple top phytoplasma TaxID=307134 RepID=A0ABT5L8H5_9MOLU|nr:ATP-binding cassette domain-containing protein [Columbia Basin potato purple top phytoplasma]MDC9031957.1 ATP-binding cassette domain-containing protein [Columbia Basin potato purple top phytoplasma]